jgi:hypothetical protein
LGEGYGWLELRAVRVRMRMRMRVRVGVRVRVSVRVSTCLIMFATRAKKRLEKLPVDVSFWSKVMMS